jgi:hypothetical protein
METNPAMKQKVLRDLKWVLVILIPNGIYDDRLAGIASMVKYEDRGVENIDKAKLTKRTKLRSRK